MRFAMTDREFFPGSQTLTKKLIYVTWQLFYTISWTLKILKETVVFYDVLCNLLAFKDDFPLLFSLWSCPFLSLCFKWAFASVAGEPR